MDRDRSALGDGLAVTVAVNPTTGAAAPVSHATVQVRPLPIAATPFAADLHLRALPHGFFARLGPGFLSVYYQSFVESPAAIALLATTHGHPAGVLVGTLDNARHYQWALRAYRGRLAVAGARALLTRPRTAGLFVRTRAPRYGRRMLASRGSAGAAPHPVEQVAVLTHVAVLPAAQRSGAGAALVHGFLQAAELAGAERATLITLAGSNGAGQFYERLGWQREQNRNDHDGQAVTVYALPLGAREAA